MITSMPQWGTTKDEKGFKGPRIQVIERSKVQGLRSKEKPYTVYLIPYTLNFLESSNPIF